MHKNQKCGMTKDDKNILGEVQPASLRLAIVAGLNSGPGRAAHIVFDRLELKYQRLLAEKKRS